MGFIEASGEGFRRYFDFRTRSSRSEFWWFSLFATLVSIVMLFVDANVFGIPLGDDGPAAGIWSLITFLPSISIAVRRLHDTNRSGWWYLLIFAILIGWIVLLVWFCTEGTEGENRFGDDPLGDAMDVFD